MDVLEVPLVLAAGADCLLRDGEVGVTDFEGDEVESYFAFAAPKPVGVSVAAGSAAEMYEVLAGADEAVGFVTVTVPVVSGVRSSVIRPGGTRGHW